MITVTYIVEAATFGCNLALNDAQAMRIFSQLKEGVDAHITIANEFAYDVLRTLIAEDKINFEHVELVLHDKAKITRHRFNTFGNLLTEDGTGPYHFQTPSDVMMHRRWMAIAAKQRTARVERETRLRAEMDARKALTIPEPLLSAVQAESEQSRAAAETYLNKVVEGARAGLQEICPRIEGDYVVATFSIPEDAKPGDVIAKISPDFKLPDTKL